MSSSFEDMLSQIVFDVKNDESPHLYNKVVCSNNETPATSTLSNDGSSQIAKPIATSATLLIKNRLKSVTLDELVWAPTRLKRPKKQGLLYAPARVCLESEVKLVAGIPDMSADRAPVEFFGLPYISYQLHYSRVEKKKLKPYNFRSNRKIVKSHVTEACEVSNDYSNPSQSEGWSEELFDALFQGLKKKYHDANDITAHILNTANNFLSSALQGSSDSNIGNLGADIIGIDGADFDNKDDDVVKNKDDDEKDAESGSQQKSSASKLLRYLPKAGAHLETETISAGDFVVYTDKLMNKKVTSKVIEVLSADQDSKHPLRLQTGYLLALWDAVKRLEADPNSGQCLETSGSGTTRFLEHFKLQCSVLKDEMTFQQRVNASAAAAVALMEKNTGGYTLNCRKARAAVSREGAPKSEQLVRSRAYDTSKARPSKRVMPSSENLDDGKKQRRRVSLESGATTNAVIGIGSDAAITTATATAATTAAVDAVACYTPDAQASTLMAVEQDEGTARPTGSRLGNVDESLTAREKSCDGVLGAVYSEKRAHLSRSSRAAVTSYKLPPANTKLRRRR